jgi:hypothetical protein
VLELFTERPHGVVGCVGVVAYSKWARETVRKPQPDPPATTSNGLVSSWPRSLHQLCDASQAKLIWGKASPGSTKTTRGLGVSWWPQILLPLCKNSKCCTTGDVLIHKGICCADIVNERDHVAKRNRGTGSRAHGVT